jgi:UDP-2,3-diacylglucosamine pyrophosphatase LpxH
LLGNHDAWLGPYYERLFDLTILAEPCDLRSGGQRVRLAHGHQLKSKMWWKRFMEGREFLETFRRLPKFVAELLQAQLELVNERTRRAAELRMIAEFEAYCRALPDPPDVVVFGHVHRVHDSGTGSVPRLVVLGDWTERSNFLSIADDDVTHSSLTDEALGQNLRVREARF